MGQRLQPTVWRTCRVLANSRRLKMFLLLVREPGLTVSAAATRLRVSLPLASLYLRALEARGVLVSKRAQRWVTYQVSEENSAVAPLVLALRASARHNDHFVDSTFKLVTAFTHPRRVDVFRVLVSRPHTTAELRVATGIRVGRCRGTWRSSQDEGSSFIAEAGQGCIWPKTTQPQLGALLRSWSRRISDTLLKV